MAIMRGDVLGCAELLTGTRFQKGFITPGGVTREPTEKSLSLIRTNLRKIQLKTETDNRLPVLKSSRSGSND